MSMSRRKFIQNSACLSATGAIACSPNTSSGAGFVGSEKIEKPLFIATWPFGKFSCEAAVKIATDSGSMLDAIEKGIWVTENDVKNASVGIGGIPNANGQVELDACIMSGPDHNAGSVAGIQDILHPISVARLVMESTPHVMLVGEGAKQFAIKNGYPETNLLTAQQKSNWENWQREQLKKSKQSQPKIDEEHHDTIAMLGLDAEGNLYGGCSTSGWGYKIPGRVGDSPIIGSGLYVDNQVGAAGATGLGENVMRHCGSFLVVEMMRQGAQPTEACEMAVNRIAEIDPKNLGNLDINFIALNKQGHYGAAGTSKGFKYSVSSPAGSQVLDAKAMSAKTIGPEGGNRK
ncbi:MAG: N(4)-(beta-N-acetylglucosaminyl)-L-asparaginase [Mariniblastus sp.]|nr:N(4)-(beta-N-acetylglucosaminyl)-L-asparaginase [Mariniblastus sp.]MDG2180367.1 N(4)-(beta-N-acetylglucosaminyl)-L-asparaginase [Mariniblastus sp.]